LNQTFRSKQRLIDASALCKQVERANVYDRDFDRKRIPESTFGQPALNRSLSTLEVLFANVAGASRFLALLAAPSSLSKARPFSTT
jgi:hypothetical protein